MGGGNRSLEWLSRRRDGESMALIAWRDGVSPQTVKRATAPYGPFPAASRHLGRTITASTALDERTQRWVDARRRGERVSDIARREGVAHQLVSRYTAEAGPFPSEEVVQEWVRARRAGKTIAVDRRHVLSARGAGQSLHPSVGAVSPARATPTGGSGRRQGHRQDGRRQRRHRAALGPHRPSARPRLRHWQEPAPVVDHDHRSRGSRRPTCRPARTAVRGASA